MDDVEGAFVVGVFFKFFGSFYGDLRTDEHFTKNDAGFCCGGIYGKSDAICWGGVGKVFGVEGADAILIDEMEDNFLG